MSAASSNAVGIDHSISLDDRKGLTFTGPLLQALQNAPNNPEGDDRHCMNIGFWFGGQRKLGQNDLRVTTLPDNFIVQDPQPIRGKPGHTEIGDLELDPPSQTASASGASPSACPI
jgi:hypothetical protein